MLGTGWRKAHYFFDSFLYYRFPAVTLEAGIEPTSKRPTHKRVEIARLRRKAIR
jgi:hypothetical protein